MNKLFLVLGVTGLLALSSCEKDYTCECTGEGLPTLTYEYEDVKKGDAEDSCESITTTGYTCEIK